jgi:LysM repeat protein
MLKTITISIAALLFCYTAQTIAEEIAIKPDAPKTYTVKEGDTLWDISGLYLQQPWQWPQLWKLNPQVVDPHLIYPGDVLSLSYDNAGNPVLSVNDESVIKVSPDSTETSTEGELIADATEVSETEQPAADAVEESTDYSSLGIRKISPTARKKLKSAKAITTLPLTMIRPFLTYEQALSDKEISDLPYVLGANEQVKNAGQGHILYIRGQLEQGASYGIYRKGKAYIDPETEALLGYETLLVGTAKAFRSGSADEKEPASVAVIDVKQEIRQGDRLLPAAQGQSLPAFFVMTKPEQSIEGVIIDTTSDLREFSKWDIVVLNKGELADVKPGHMFSIYRQSPSVVDTKTGPVYSSDATEYQEFTGGIDGEALVMPREKVGELMVFKVSERTSFAIVTGTKKPIRVGDAIGDL